MERHRGHTLADLANAWEAGAEPFDVLLGVIPEPVNSQVVVDAVAHEHDLRHALGAPGARDSDAVEVALGWALHMADRAAPGAADTLLGYGLDRFTLLRVCTGRRSREQIAALGIDPALVEAQVAGSPVHLPAHAVDE